MIFSIVDSVKWIKTNIVWGIPSIILILAVGIILTIKLKGLQVSHLGESLKYMVQNEKGGAGEVSTFAALCISMAATLGTGKIVGVASAIAIGGAGALFWMIIAALFGMATKYAEGFLAIRFRKKEADGSYLGGPFMYIEKGMGQKWKWLAICFAVCGALCALMGIGTTTQMNSITDSFVSVFDANKEHYITIFGNHVTYTAIIVGAIITILSAISVIGGIERISKVSVYLVPFMAVGYFVVCLLIVLFNVPAIPSAFVKIFKSAFDFKSVAGGATGIGIIVAMREGISKGVFSNEAGLGSAPIALASGKTKDPVRQGLVCMSGTFIDTMVLCLTIGLGIVITGAAESGAEGVNITIFAFQEGLGISQKIAAIIVMVSITTFAFTTIIGWNVYGEKCISYLTKNNKKAVFVYKILYIIVVGIAPYLSLELIWTLAEIFNGLMAIPNLIALFVLSGLVARETKNYFNNKNVETRLDEFKEVE